MPWEEVDAWGDQEQHDFSRETFLTSRFNEQIKGMRWYHSDEVASGGKTTAMRDLWSVSGGMEQPTVLLDGHLDRDRTTEASASETFRCSFIRGSGSSFVQPVMKLKDGDVVLPRLRLGSWL